MSPLELKVRLLLKSYTLSDILEALDIDEEEIMMLLMDEGYIDKEDLDEL